MPEDKDANAWLFGKQGLLGGTTRADELDGVLVERKLKSRVRAGRWEIWKGISFGVGLTSAVLGVIGKLTGYW